MTSKPILLWPKPPADVESHLGQAADHFLVVDTNSSYELQKLYRLTHSTPVFDPFPRGGRHHREFADHLLANNCSLHIVGLAMCRSVLQAQKDPSLAHAPVEELLMVFAPARGGAGHGVLDRVSKFHVDWSRLNWANTVLAVVLVFTASLIANALFLGNGVFAGDALTAAAVAGLVFAALYVVARIELAESLFSKDGRNGKPPALDREARS